MKSPTKGNCTIEQMVDQINEFYQRNKIYETGFEITIGTDSQNFSDTKVVKVMAIRCIGHGGIYFYEVTHVDKISDVRQKLNLETEISLDLANAAIKVMESDKKYEELYLNTNFAIHVDAGKSNYGKTKDLIPGIVGWIKACGYDCVVKPDSYAASSIADKISK